jgi:hypothetical protein
MIRQLLVVGMFVSTFVIAGEAEGAVRITEFMSEGQGDIDSGNGGRRQREFFELTNLGAAAVDVSTWSYNDNNVNDPHNWGPAIGSIAAGESIIFTQMSVADFRHNWGLPASVRVYSYLQASNLGNNDTISIYNSFTQEAVNLVDSLSYTETLRGSGVSRNRPWDGGTGQYGNGDWVISSVGDSYQSYLAPNPPSFAAPYDNPAIYTDLANPGRYVNVPEPGVLALVVLGGCAGIAMWRSKRWVPTSTVS